MQWLSTNLLRFVRLLTVVWPPSLLYCGLCFCVFCLFVSGYPSCFLSFFLPLFTSVIVVLVLVAQTTLIITFTGNLEFWHPCHDSFFPHLWKYCHRELSLLCLILECLDPVICFFFCCCNFCYVSIKKKKNKKKKKKEVILKTENCMNTEHVSVIVLLSRSNS